MFKEVAPVQYDTVYPTSIRPGPQHPWMVFLRTLKASSLVCRAWCGPAVEILYSNIVIRWTGQVAAFARTLKRSHRLGWHVKRIHIHGCLIMPELA